MSEHDEQSLVFAWAALSMSAYPELAMLYAIPNGAKLPWRKNSQGKRYSPEAIRLKSEGLRPGVPDMCLPVPRGEYHGLYIELKCGTNKPSPAQREWIDALNKNGYWATWAVGADAAIEIIRAYLEYERKER